MTPGQRAALRTLWDCGAVSAAGTGNNFASLWMDMLAERKPIRRGMAQAYVYSLSGTGMMTARQLFEVE